MLAISSVAVAVAGPLPSFPFCFAVLFDVFRREGSFDLIMAVACGWLD